MKDLSFLELFILNTLVYFDIFDYPLTLSELHSYFFTGGMEGGKYTLTEIKETLATSPKLQELITTERGFYFLKNREKIIDIRLARYNISNEKFKIVKRAVSIFKFLPFIKLIAVCNSLAYGNARAESDLDLFIITSPKRIWLTRFLLMITSSFLGLRPPKDKVADKLCLSFYTTENNLAMQNIKIAAEDVYLVYWLATLWPIYDRGDYYAKLLQANKWLDKYLPNYQPNLPNHCSRLQDSNWSRFVYKSKEFVFGGFVGDFLEVVTKMIQEKYMSQKKKDLAINDDSRVIISDEMLKFHENDRRLEYLQKFEAKQKELLNQL